MIGFLASIKAGITTLTGRLTSTRAGYLDNIQYYTQTRAGYVDLLNTYLNATVSSRLAAIKTCRYGTVTVSISSDLYGSGTDTFSAVDTAKTVLIPLGHSCGTGSSESSVARLTLTNTTTVTASVNLGTTASATVTVGYLLVEFN